MSRFLPITFDPIPVDRIGVALGCILTPGPAHMTPRAQRHAESRHPADFMDCMAARPYALQNPTFAGQAPHHRDNFELIYEIHRGSHAVLVAVGVKIDDKGRYRIRSTYLVEVSKVQRRIRAGRLRRVAAP